MQKRILSILTVFAMMLTILPDVVLASGGSGTASDPYKISTAAELEGIGDGAAGTYYQLENDINVDRSFKTIESFKGILNGNGKKITGIDTYMEISYAEGKGNTKTTSGALFNTIESTAAIYNLTLDAPKFTNLFANIEVGHNGALEFKRGIFAVTNKGLIDSLSINNANINATFNRDSTCLSLSYETRDFGGIVYENTGKLINSSIGGYMQITDGQYMSGVAVKNSGTIANMRSSITIDVKVNSGFNVQDLKNTSCGVGENSGLIYNLWTDGTIKVSASNIKPDPDYNGYICAGNIKGGRVLNSYYKNTSSESIVKTGVGVKGSGTAENIIEKSSLDSTIYNNNTASSDIIGLKKLNDTTQPNIVTWNMGNEAVKTELVYGSATVSLPIAVNDDYYCESWKVSDGNKIINSPGSYTVTKSVNFTAQNPQGRYYPVFNGTVKLFPDTTALPEYEYKWKQVGSDDFVKAPSDVDIAYSGGMKKYIAKGSTYDSSFSEEYTGGFKVNDYIYIRYKIAENNGKLKSGTFNMYDGYTPAFRVFKVTVNADNISEYFDVNIPTDQKYLANGDYTFPTVTPKTGARFEYTGTSTISYTDSEGNRVYGNGYPTKAGTYNVWLSIDGDSNFYGFNNLNIGTYTIGKRDVSESEIIFDKPEGYRYGDTVKIDAGIKAKTTADGTVDYVKEGKLKLYVDDSTEPYGGSEKSVFGYSITFNVTELELGDHKFKVEYSGSDNYEAKTFNLNATISREVPTINFSFDKDKYTYGDDMLLTVSAPDNNLKIKDYKDDNETEEYINANIEYVCQDSGKFVYKYNKPKSGNHYIKVIYNGSSYYDTGSKKLVGTVKKAKLEPTVNLRKSNWHYGDDVKVYVTVPDPAGVLDDGNTEAATYTVKLVDGNGFVVYTGTAAGSIPADDFEIGFDEKVAAGEYTARLTIEFEDGSDYETYAAGSVGILSVGKAEPIRSDFEISASGLRYDKNPHIIQVGSRREGMGDITVLYEDVNNQGTLTGEAPTNAGLYNIYVNVTEGTNYTSVNGLLVSTVQILRKNPESSEFNVTLNSSSDRAFTYNGLPVSAEVTPAEDGSFNITKVQYFKKDADGNYTVLLSEAPTAPGEYAVKCDTEISRNYLAATELTVAEFTIKRASTVITLSEPSKAEYTTEEDVIVKGALSRNGDSAQFPSGRVTAIAADSTGYGYIDEVIGENGEFEIAIPTRAKSYTIVVNYGGDDNYLSYQTNDVQLNVVKTPVSFRVSGTEQRYLPGIERQITVENNTKKLTGSDIEVRYYPVDENNGVLSSVMPVVKAVSAGRYMYVISLSSDAEERYQIQNEFKVSSTEIPDFSLYGNAGYLDIKSGTEETQKPIYFQSGIVNKKTTDAPFINPLTNDNASTVIYKSSDDTIASVAADGTVTIHKSGSVTITAESVKSGTTPVYASYLLSIGREAVKISAVDKEITYGEEFTGTDIVYPDGMSAADFGGTLGFKTDYSAGKKVGTYDITPYGLTSDVYEIVFEGAYLTVNPRVLNANDFTVSAADKVYDGTNTVKLSVATAIQDIKASAEGAFVDVNAGADKEVRYTINEITGKDAQNYVLENGAVDGTVSASIETAKVTVICAPSTTRTYDGSVQSVEISAMANGRAFTDFSIKYMQNGAEVQPVNVGVYTVTAETSDANYEILPFSATLTIKSASQEVFSIENVPDNVYYGDTFAVSTDGAEGTVAYSTDNTEIAEIDNNGNVTAKAPGRVSIIAESTKDGYISRIAVKKIDIKKRILTPSAAAANRTYNGENGVDVSVELENIKDGDNVTATAKGTMINSDAGSQKIVYVSDIRLSDETNYTLSTQSVQTTADISPIDITAFEIKADSKKYDGTAAAQAAVIQISDILNSDTGLVEIVGKAEFDSADSGDRTVMFTADSLAGTKAANYRLTAASASAAAKIEPLKVNFVIGQTTFIYDGTDKELAVSATDENGRIFRDFTVSYNETPNAAKEYSAEIVLNDTVNYVTDQTAVVITITEAAQNQLVIAGLPGTIEYGDSFKLEAFGGADNGTVVWSVNSGAAEVSQDGTVEITGTGKVEIEAVKKSENYNDVSAKVMFTAVPKNVTFELGNLEQTYGNVTEVSVVPSVSAAYQITYDGDTVLPQNAGKYKVKVVTDDPNYSGSAADTLIINKAQPTGSITVNDTYTYGDTVSAAAENIPEGANAEITYAGTGIYVPESKAPSNAGSYTAIATISGANYETLTVTKNFTIAKAELTVRAKDAKRAYGEANPVFELEYEGFKNGETKDVLLYEPTATVNANASSAVGSYDITVSGGNAENYTFKYDNTGKLEITGATGGSLYITGSSNTAYVGDVFSLHAFYGNTKVNATWESSDASVAEISQNGSVTALKAGTAVITATAEENYGFAQAEFELTVKQTGITLVPSGLVKTYNGQRQDISFEPVSGFTPILSGDGKNVDVKYTLISDPSVTEPVRAGIYSVTYTVLDGNVVGGGTATMYINKADINVKPDDATKVYGDETSYRLVADSNLITADELNEVAASAIFTSDGADRKAKAGEYDISVVLQKTSNDNLSFIVSGTGKLNVTKAPLTVKVKNAVREYGADNPMPEAEYFGFKNDETYEVLGGELIFTFADDINTDTPVGVYADKISASGYTSDNYEISYESGSVEITKIGVNASAGAARNSYLTIEFDKALEGLTADSFIVKNGEEVVALTSVTPSEDNKSYTLRGNFDTSVTYTVSVSLTSDIYTIVSEPLSIKPARTSGGGSSGGGGGGSAASVYTVKFETNGGSKVANITAARNTAAKEPEAPTKDGYDFAGWYTDSALKTKCDWSAKVTKNITLYAAWTEKAKDNTINQIILTIGEKTAQVFGVQKTNDVAPKIVNDRTMLPARFVAENLGAKVDWDEANEIVTISGKNFKTGEDITILINIDSDTAYVNGKEVKLDSPAFIENDRTYTPIRFISEELGADVEWFENTQRVIITKP